VAQIMIRNGEIELGELSLSVATSDEALGVDGETSIPYMIDPETKRQTYIKVEKIKPNEMSESPAGDIYRATYPVREKGKIIDIPITYPSRQEMITEIISRMRVE
jgi:hypothetical protein